MGYSEQFRDYREGRGLTREQLAARAACHRNTVINVESGRPVRFATIVVLMQHLGYPKDSAEVKRLAQMWLEAVAGVRLGDEIATPSRRESTKTTGLAAELSGQRLSRGEVELLTFAARNRKVLNALRAIRDLVDDSAPTRAS